MKIIRDIVHGYIKIEERDRCIIDTQSFQRLKSIRQTNPFSVYPCANHTRFEHSLGVMHLGGLVVQALINNGIDHEQITPFKTTIRYACLLHDVGHAPFSHLGERLYDKQKLLKILLEHPQLQSIDDKFKGDGGASHELCSCILSLDKYYDFLNNEGVNINLFCRMIIGEKYGTDNKEIENMIIDILNSPIDVDKLDYLLRDSYMSGANLVNIDIERLISAYTFHQQFGCIALSGKALSTISNFIYGRDAVYTWIVNHHVNVYTNRIFAKILDLAFESFEDKEQFFSYEAISNKLIDDHDVISFIRLKTAKNDTIAHLYNKLSYRDYYKTIWKNNLEFETLISDQAFRDLLTLKIKEYESELGYVEEKIAKQIKADPEDIIIAIADYKRYTMLEDKAIYIIINGDCKRFDIIFQNSIHKTNKNELPFIFVKDQSVKNNFLENRKSIRL